MLLLLAALLPAVGTAHRAAQSQPNPPLVIVMTPTGETRDGLPVHTRHQGAAEQEAALTRGFSLRWLKLYRLEQQFLQARDGRAVEPAYLLLSTNQGGFPRFGFWLDDERKAGVGYVDLHERSTPTGRFGAIDQIFPHELAHVIVRELAGPPPGPGGANQVHAIGVRTDRLTAFNEGFAEHVQVLAVDDPDADVGTRALVDDRDLARLASARLKRYERALRARWSLAPPARIGFALWFSGTEQALRYHAVKANAFAREADLPPAFIARHPYHAYLAESVLPGSAGAPFKETARLLATEGAISALFARWVVDPRLQEPVADAAFYARFGGPTGLDPIDQSYLKLFAVLADYTPHDAAALVQGYVLAFPQEAGAVGALMRELGFDWPIPRVPELWLANEGLQTGTTLFDQYRALPHVHTFDLNAASRVDLVSVDGVTLDLADAIRSHAPFGSIDALAAVPGLTPALLDRFRHMASAMDTLRIEQARTDIESIDLLSIFRPVMLRAAGWVLVVSLIAALVHRAAGRLARWRAVVNGLAVGVTALLPAWMLGASGAFDTLVGPLVPVVAFGLPGSLWQVAVRRSTTDARRCLLAWAIAGGPAWLVLTPLF